MPFLRRLMFRSRAADHIARSWFAPLFRRSSSVSSLGESHSAASAVGSVAFAGPSASAASAPRNADAMRGLATPLVSSRQLLLFGLLWLIIGGVSAVDTYLTVRDQESLFYLELNPVARWLLEWHDWNPATLVGLKFLGSMAVLGVLAVGFLREPKRTLVVAGSLAVLQSALLLFLAAA